MAALSSETALMLVRRLSALKDYPRLVDGETWFALKFADAVVSVQHAEAVIDRFRGNFPSLEEMEAVALNLRPQFEKQPTHEQRIAEWKAGGATYDPEWTEKLKAEYAARSETFNERHQREWQTVVSTWRAEDLTGRRHREYPPDLAVAQLRQKLGYELTPWDRQVLNAAGRREEVLA